MKINIEITEAQKRVLNRKFLVQSNPYGNKVTHIHYINSVRCYLNDEELDEFIECRDELVELGLLNFLSMSNGTLRFYELTKIGWMFFNELNK